MKTAQLHLLIAGLLVIGALVACVLWYTHVDTLRDEVATLKSSRLAAEAETARILEAKNALATLAASEDRINSFFVPEEDVVPFLESIGSTGDALGSTVEVVSVTADKSEGPRGRMTIALRIAGSFASVMRTLGALEFGPFDSRLVNVSLDRGKEGWTASATYSIGTRKSP